jgi:hypothetical protein
MTTEAAYEAALDARNATLAAEANYMAHVVDKFGGPIMFGGPILGQVGHGKLRNVVNDHLKEPKP